MAEVDESNGEEKSEPVSEMEASVKGQNLGCVFRHFSNKFHFHVDLVHEQSTIPYLKTLGSDKFFNSEGTYI